MRLRTLVLVLAAIAGAHTRLSAQQAATDTSLAARLAKAERAIEVLRQQVAEQAKGGVQPKQGNKVELSGLVLMNGFFNNAKVNNADIPTFVLTPDPPGFLPNSALGGTARQSQFALTTIVPNVLNATFTGELDMDFYGGHENFARLFPLLHLKRTRAELRWPHGWLMFGQEAAPISEVNPSGFASRSIPGFTNAGNLWFWVPQVRVGGDVGTEVRIGVEAAALAPVSTEAAPAFNPDPSQAERSRRPAGEARLLVRWDKPQATGEISIGGHYGWLATPALDTLIISRAVAASVRVRVEKLFEVRGEAYMGQALGGLGGGGIGQTLGSFGQPVRSKGGWGQLNIIPVREVEVGGGYGFDDPDDRDLNLATARLKNVMMEGHIQYMPGPLVFSVEFKRVETTYTTAGTLFVHHFNVGMGFRF